jgi:hypothetical protein
MEVDVFLEDMLQQKLEFRVVLAGGSQGRNM